MATVLIDKLLQACVKQGASDIHITVGQPPVFRLHGRMRKLETKELTPEDTVALMKSIAPERCQRELQETGSSDFGFAFGTQARFRVSIFKQKGNIAMVLRQIPTDKLTPEQLGLPEAVVKLVLRPRGLMLVTGPTGSGKSTTLASLVNYINENVDHHIITIEDPIEFYHDHKKSTINQREVGVDVPSFAEAIRRALRQDPDVILVGELRDLETIEAAISAAETGHVVFGTLHTNSAQGTVNRIIDAFPGNLQDQIRTQLSTSLIGVVAQTLLPRIGGGRVAAYEILMVTSGIANLIRENKTFRINSAIQTGAKHGMQLMDDALFNLWKRPGLHPRRRARQGKHSPPTTWRSESSNRRGAEDGEEEGDELRRSSSRRRRLARERGRAPRGASERAAEQSSSDQGPIRPFVGGTRQLSLALEDSLWPSDASDRFSSTSASSPMSSWKCAGRTAAAARRAAGQDRGRDGTDHGRSAGPGARRADADAGRHRFRRLQPFPTKSWQISETMAQLYRVVPVAFRRHDIDGRDLRPAELVRSRTSCVRSSARHQDGGVPRSGR